MFSSAEVTRTDVFSVHSAPAGQVCSRAVQFGSAPAGWMGLSWASDHGIATEQIPPSVVGGISAGGGGVSGGGGGGATPTWRKMPSEPGNVVENAIESKVPVSLTV